jgi:hypothetical protein
LKANLPVVLTPSRTEEAASCQRKHVLKDVLEWGKESNVAADFGTVMHAGVGALHNAKEYGQVQAPEASEAAQRAIVAAWSEHKLEGRSEKYTLDRALVSMAAYEAQYQRVGPYTELPLGWKVLTVEDRVRLPVGEHIMSFQIDRAYQAGDMSRIAVTDLKTVTRPDAAWKSKWYKSVQMKLYKYGAQRTYGVEQVDIAIEGLDKNVKPKLHYVMLPDWSKAMLDEAVNLFQRTADKDHKLIAAAQDETGAIDLMKLEELALSETDYNYGACFAYGSWCAFHELCTSDPDQRLGLLHADFQQIEADY